MEQIVDFPEQTVDQIVDTSPGAGLGQGSSSSAGPADIGFFRTFPRGKKVRVPPRVRVRECLRTRAHGRRRLMRRPVVRMCGLSSTTTSRARPTTGTDVLVFLPGSLLRASRSSGSACGTLRGGLQLTQRNTCQYLDPSSSSSWLMDYGVRGLAPPHPILGASRVVDNGGMYTAGVAGLPLRAVLLPVGARPMVRYIMAGMDQRYSMSVLRWFARECSPRAVFLPVFRPTTRCIMAVLDQKDSLLAVACARLVLLVWRARCF